MTTRGTISPTRITRATIDTQMIVIITIIAVVTQGMLTMTRSIKVEVIMEAFDSIQWREAQARLNLALARGIKPMVIAKEYNPREITTIAEIDGKKMSDGNDQEVAVFHRTHHLLTLLNTVVKVAIVVRAVALEVDIRVESAQFRRKAVVIVVIVSVDIETKTHPPSNQTSKQSPNEGAHQRAATLDQVVAVKIKVRRTNVVLLTNMIEQVSPRQKVVEAVKAAL